MKKQSILPFEKKIVHFKDLAIWRRKMNRLGKKVVVTNGCFDILHAGHVAYLERARSHGDVLIVGVNDDTGVRTLKGPDRPINSELDRASVLAGLASVDAVCIFEGHTATAFLELAAPAIYVKGGDYTLDKLHKEERRAVESVKAKICFIPFVLNKSTTLLIQKVRQK